MGKEVAPESVQTARAREKLEKAWEAEKKRVTPEALKETVGKIHQWIADNAAHRLPIKGKGIRLFDRNENAAQISKRVERIAEKIKFG